MRKILPLLAMLVLSALLTVALNKIATGSLHRFPGQLIPSAVIQFKAPYIGVLPDYYGHGNTSFRLARSPGLLNCFQIA